MFNVYLRSWIVEIEKNDYILKYWDFVRLLIKEREKESNKDKGFKD